MTILEGGLVADPELAFSQQGKAWVRFRVACKDRVRGENGTWVDGDATFIDVVAFGKPAEHFVESVRKGDQVFVVGKLQQQEYEKDGQKRTSYRILADTFGPTMMFGTALTAKASGVSSPVSGYPTQSEEPPF
jgi:single-strand DNA-binding protein